MEQYAPEVALFYYGIRGSMDASSSVARSYLLLGVAWYEKGDQESAIASYTKAIDTIADYPEAWANRGLSEAMIDNYKDAIRDEDRAIRLNPKDAHAWYFRGFVYDRQKQYEKAIADYSSALQVATGDAVKKVILYRRGLAQVKRHKESLALKDFNEAINLDQSFAAALFARATLMQNSGNVADALADYSRVIDLDPRDAEARYRRGTIYRKERKDHLAIVDYNHALKIDPRMEKARLGRRYVYLIPILPILLVLMLG